MKMADQRCGVIMNVLAGRMGTKQPLIRPILAITKDGGWKPQNGDTSMPDPKLEKQIARTGHLILVFHVGDWIAPTDDLVWDLGMMVGLGSRNDGRRCSRYSPNSDMYRKCGVSLLQRS